jgi:peptidoglycan/xylan/chitin deacetylase (PgdA/CDA1 family)
MRIGSHSMTHPNLCSLDQRRLDAEVRDSKHVLEDVIGAPVTSFAYPAGAVNERVRNAVAAAGYRTAFTAADGLNQWPDPFLISRASLSESDSIASFALKLATGRGLESHRRRALIGATKLALRVFPSDVEAKLSRAARDTDARALARRWNARTKELAEIGARSRGDGQ